MQPESGGSLIDRAVKWIRGMWAGSAERTAGRTKDAGDATSRERSADAERVPATQGDDVAANGQPAPTAAPATGASQDEFATGGYTTDNPTLGTVETAAEGADERPGETSPAKSVGEDDTAPLTDQQMNTATPPSGNYGVGNLELGSRASLGAAPPLVAPDESAAAAAGEGLTELAAAAIPDDTASRQPGTIEADSPANPMPDDGANVSNPDVPASAEENVRGISQAGEDELGRLDELDQDAVAFESDADEEFDENSQPGFAADVPRSLAEIDDETGDYTSSALEDAGMRIVDEDEAGITSREPAPDEFVDPGSVIDEPAADTGDARPLGDFTQQQSGIASEADEATGAAGDRRAEPFGSETAMDMAETWSDEASTEGLGSAGDVAATDFGSTVDTEEQYAAAHGMVEEAGVDVADLSYLDAAEDARFDFPSASEVVTARDEVILKSTGVVDDIGASPTGVSDPQLAAGTGAVRARDVPDSAGAVDDIAASPTGAVDTAATAQGLDDGSGTSETVREHVPLAPSDAPPVASPAGTGPGGSVRGDAAGACPADYPIKGNSSSKIYHLPETASYAGTKAEWCFANEAQAHAAGYRPPGQRSRAAGGRPSGSGSTSGRRSRGKGASTR